MVGIQVCIHVHITDDVSILHCRSKSTFIHYVQLQFVGACAVCVAGIYPNILMIQSE